jgi:hypothetical protein
MLVLGRKGDAMKASFPILLVNLLIASQGCGFFDECNDAADPCIAKVIVFKDSMITRDMYHVTLTQGFTRWYFGPEDFSNPSWSPPELQTCSRGQLGMDIVIRAAGGEIVSTGSMRWAMEPDTYLRIWLMRDDHHRLFHEPTAAKAFPILNSSYRLSEQDSLFVLWSTNSISDPIEY